MTAAPSTTTRDVLAVAAGLLFGLGLGLSGMTNPAKVLGFLDVAGRWDASLMLVMAGAIGVHLPLSRLVRRRPAPLFDRQFHLPARRQVDRRLVAGSVLFGVGWGLMGYCPGPVVVSLATLNSVVLAFVAAMLVGMIAFHILESRVT